MPSLDPPGWGDNDGESFTDDAQNGAEDVGSVVGDAVGLVTELGET